MVKKKSWYIYTAEYYVAVKKNEAAVQLWGDH